MYLASRGPHSRRGHHVHALSFSHLQSLLKMTPKSLNNVSFWTPPAFQGAKGASQLPQRRPDPLFPAESSPLPTREQLEEPWTCSGQTQDDPISVLSDVESVVSALESRHTDQGDSEDSVSTLPSISSIITSLPRPDRTKRTGAESEADPGVDVTPALSPALVNDASIWPHETQPPQLADVAGPRSSCGISDMLTTDASACQYVNPATPTPENQLSPLATDGQRQLDQANQQGNNILDAVVDRDSGHDDQELSPWPSTPPTWTARHVEAASVQQSQLVADNSCANVISAAQTPSPGQPSPTSHQTQRLNDISGPRSRDKLESRYTATQVQGKMRFQDGDIDSEGSESDGGPAGPEPQHCEQKSHSFPASEDSSSDDDNAHQGHKRRKVSQSSSCSLHSTSVSSRSSWRRRPERSAAPLSSKPQASGCSVNNSAQSEANPAHSRSNVHLAQFEQWPLRDVFLKRITEGGKTTFQLQFKWDTDSCDAHTTASTSQPKKKRLIKKSGSSAGSSGGRWMPKKEETVRVMRQAGKSWSDIQRAIPHRSEGTIQVRYSTKLKGLI